MKNILITGGSGFIGTNFIYYLIENTDFNVINIDKLTYAGNLENLKSLEKEKRYKFYKGDIVDKKFIESTIKENNIDTIVHFAAETHVDKSIEDPSIFIKSNVLGTQILLDLVLKYDLRFHHVSTDEVFGSLQKEDPPFNEETKYDPKSPYSASKAASDFLVKAYYNTYKIKATISNCSNNYGPYQHPEKLIPKAITNLLENKKIPVYGSGKNIRDWLFVQDHCKAILLILKNAQPGTLYCVGGDCEKTNNDIVKFILKEMNFNEDMMEYVADRKGHDFRYAIDSSKIKKELGWEPEHTFEDAMKKTIKWYKENVKWWTPLKEGD